MKRLPKSKAAQELGLRLGKRIAKHRKKKEITQAFLAEEIGVDSETISRFERGTALPSLLRLFEIARVLEVGIGDLLAEASTLPRDAEHVIAGMLDEICPEDQKLLAQFAELLRMRKQ